MLGAFTAVKQPKSALGRMLQVKQYCRDIARAGWHPG